MGLDLIEYKVISLTYNTLKSSQPSYLRHLFTIQSSHSTRSSSTLTLLSPSVTSSLNFSNPLKSTFGACHDLLLGGFGNVAYIGLSSSNTLKLQSILNAFAHLMLIGGIPEFAHISGIWASG